MMRLLPSPWMSLAIVVLWFLLNGVSVGHAILALALALVVPLLVVDLRPDRPKPRRVGVIVALSAVVIYDIIKSAIELAFRIIGPESRIKPTYLWIPLEVRDPHAITALAGIITMTPGTLSADLSADQKHLLVHCFHTDDVDATRADIKQRYERRLKEIFE